MSPLSAAVVFWLAVSQSGSAAEAFSVAPRASRAGGLAGQRAAISRWPSLCTTMIFSDRADVTPNEMQQMLRRDIQRRYSELTALGWLGRVWLAVPFVFDAFWPSVFALDAFEPAFAPCYRFNDGQVLCTLKESSVVARGIPFQFMLQTDGASITHADLLSIGPDLCDSDATAQRAGAELMDYDDVKAVCNTIRRDRLAKRLLVLAVVSTIFERLGQVPQALEQEVHLEASGAEYAFVPRKDLWAQEGSTEKWLQQVAGYYFADSRLQTVRFAVPQSSAAEGPSAAPSPRGSEGAGRGGGLLFDFYLDPTEPLNSKDLYRNINPEVIACHFVPVGEPYAEEEDCKDSLWR